MRWGVWCTVSGGVTGHRCSWLKSEGEVQVFNTREEAAEEAAKCREAVRGGFARFTYSPQEIDHA